MDYFTSLTHINDVFLEKTRADYTLGRDLGKNADFDILEYNPLAFSLKTHH